MNLLGWSDLTIAGIPAAALIVAAVQICIGAGMPKRWAPALAAAIGLTVGLMTELALRDPSIGGWIDAALVGLWIGIAAVGGHATVDHTLSAVRSKLDGSND